MDSYSSTSYVATVLLFIPVFNENEIQQIHKKERQKQQRHIHISVK
jgi:hypothetical protein